MKKNGLRFLGVFILGVGFWASASAILGTVEPWDAPYYWAWYLASLAIAAVVGWVLPARSWCWGAIIVFAQAPVMLAHTSPEPLFVVAFGWLALEAIPALLISGAAGKARSLLAGRRLRASR
ncbi:hypothetical protein [Brevundimonas sp. G8]|uniref:hypothetical protein n=1 Tax=Brevundimonas sp. G8 TaxID=1350776 RepID=UPI00135B6C17|nr:hypothetical protein [Brevundimonas sp. G8]